ncbi:hypothetical protein [Halorientalis salina]|uniref:hypothetical protein n=1 Tax=Halorientalis salina TaxID=2932266 RepID=UPI0010ACD19B|nr:hypothetical protein [Halorientalis salina]
MPSSQTTTGFLDRATSQRNVSIYTAIAVAAPTAYAFNVAFTYEGSFLLLMTLAVGVPTAYDDYGPAYDRTPKTVGWVLVACGIAAVEFVGFFVVATESLELSAFLGGIVAFLGTWLLNLSVLVVRQHAE